MAFILLLVTGPGLDARDLQAMKCDSGVWVREDGKPVLFYRQTPVSHQGEYTRNHYIHPLYGLEQELLTEDFPADHLHQRGIFWAWHQVLVNGKSVGDMWLTEDFIWDVQEVKTIEQNNFVVLQTRVLWKSPELLDHSGQLLPFVEENSRIIVYPSNPNTRIIDFSIQIKPLEDEVEIGGSDNEKGYGGFSARFKLPENIGFMAEYGAVNPKRTAVPSSPWMDFRGDFMAGHAGSGVLIISHPDNPGHPPEWIIRKARSMQNPVYPGRIPVKMSPNHPVSLKYRIVIHEKELKKTDISRLYEDYKDR